MDAGPGDSGADGEAVGAGVGVEAVRDVSLGLMAGLTAGTPAGTADVAVAECRTMSAAIRAALRMIKPPIAIHRALLRSAPSMARSLTTIFGAPVQSAVESSEECPALSNLEQFRIFCVCTGNICRSPVAERLLAVRLGPGVVVSSGGTYGVLGAPISPPMARLLGEAEIASADFSARRVTPEELRAADLVLTMTKEQRRDVVDLAPAVVRRAFTLREFARLLDGLEPDELPGGTSAERLRVAVRSAATRRSPSAADEIDDPYGGSEADYIRAFGEIDDAVTTIARIAGGRL